MNDGSKFHAGDAGKRQFKSIRLLALCAGGSINPVQDVGIVFRRGAARNDVKWMKVGYFSSSQILKQST